MRGTTLLTGGQGRTSRRATILPGWMNISPCSLLAKEKRDMSRSNRVFGLLVTVVLVLSVLAACAPVAAPTAAQSAATSAPATAAPAAPATVAAPGGAANTLVFATNMSDLITLDPATMYAWTGILIVHNLYQ